jgi:hypothetical protein
MKHDLMKARLPAYHANLDISPHFAVVDFRL